MPATAEISAFKVETLVYEGPLDLLLQLIEGAELDITGLSLAKVTSQFLEYLRNMENRSAEEVSTFLVIAARLIQIKSEVLLPRPVEREPWEEDPGEALARQLIAYKRYKEIAQTLSDRESQGWKTYLRLAKPPKIDPRLDLEGVTARDLWEAARDAYNKAPAQTELGSIVTRPIVTIRQKIRSIVTRIRTFGKTRFSDILGDVQSRIDVVVSFLAMLELIKSKRVSAVQDFQFGEIEITPAERWDDSSEMELEFGE